MEQSKIIDTLETYQQIALQEVNNTHKNKQNNSWSYEQSGLMKHAHIHKSEYGFSAKHWR